MKFKLENRVHVLFEAARPDFLHGMLRYLKFYNHAFTTWQRCYDQKWFGKGDSTGRKVAKQVA